LYQKCYPDSDEAIQENREDIDLDFLTEDFPKLLGSMQGATDRVKSISTSLRTFSRADTEHKVSANLNEGIDSTLLILKYRLKANEFRPAIEVIKNYGDVADIECFPGQLNQVFMNIFANAIDALNEASEGRSFAELQEHPHCITVRTRVEQSKLTIAISDNGSGIPESVKERIFDNLFTTKAVGKGTGLGLAISRQIVVDKHGGSLSVTSNAGQGTTFLICLPMNG
ncbi:MAG: HAMP domain-containing sensor histidine kinase, partial [Cyanobacteria bacterium J06621_3]